MTPYIIVGMTWITGLVCATYLIVEGHPWMGALVLLVTSAFEVRRTVEHDKEPD